jgi:hypothetical protein
MIALWVATVASWIACARYLSVEVTDRGILMRPLPRVNMEWKRVARVSRVNDLRVDVLNGSRRFQLEFPSAPEAEVFLSEVKAHAPSLMPVEDDVSTV